MTHVDLRCGDALDVLRTLAAESVQCVVTSPPYWGLRDYGVAGQLGLEQAPEEYVARLVEVFAEVRRVLRDDGTLWLNLGDSYTGSASNGKSGWSFGSIKGYTDDGRSNLAARTGVGLKPKDLCGIPWRVAFALQADGWWLRSDIIWAKPNPMPESVTDRPTKAHEYLFLLTHAERYYYDAEAIAEAATDWGPRNRNGKAESGLTGLAPHHGLSSSSQRTSRNRRTVWTIPTQPFPGAHFATMPEALVEPCIAAGSREGDTVLDPFCGSGTVGVVASRAGRNFLGIDLSPEYVEMARRRIGASAPLFMEKSVEVKG